LLDDLVILAQLSLQVVNLLLELLHICGA
jgi:hypothetical protein